MPYDPGLKAGVLVVNIFDSIKFSLSNSILSCRVEKGVNASKFFERNVLNFITLP